MGLMCFLNILDIKILFYIFFYSNKKLLSFDYNIVELLRFSFRFNSFCDKSVDILYIHYDSVYLIDLALWVLILYLKLV